MAERTPEFEKDYPPAFDAKAGRPRHRVVGEDGKPVNCSTCGGTGLKDDDTHCPDCLGTGHELEPARAAA